jgi:hypothetical protein
VLLIAHYGGNWTRNVIGRVVGLDTATARYLATAATFDPTDGERGTTTVTFLPLPPGETRIVNTDTGPRLTTTALEEYLPARTVDTAHTVEDRAGPDDPR